MTHVIVHCCRDHVFDPAGYERTALLSKGIKPGAEGYYVLFDRPRGIESQADPVIAGPFVRLRNAEEAADEIERRCDEWRTGDVARTHPE